MIVSSSELWGAVATAIDGARRARDLDVPRIALEAGLDDSTVRRLLAAEPVRMSSLHLVLGVVGLEWDDLLLSLAAAS